MYQLIKNPGGCACGGCFLVVVVIVLGIVAYVLLAPYFIWIGLAVAAAYGLRAWRRYALRKRAEREQR